MTEDVFGVSGDILEASDIFNFFAIYLMSSKKQRHGIELSICLTAYTNFLLIIFSLALYFSVFRIYRIC